MQIRRVTIQNFRGIKEAELDLPRHAVLVGDNNSCKSTVLEALDLTLGPDRISRPDPIDEHDFYAGEYLDAEGKPVAIKIEVVIIGLSDQQQRRFADHLEWWNEDSQTLLQVGQAAYVDQPNVSPAIRVAFDGRYDPEEDDFKAETCFASSRQDNGNATTFSKADKRSCGFLYLRALRTGSRALSLERGSLLDIILQLEDKRPQMWENVLQQLRAISVAEDASLGISDVLNRVQDAVQSYVTSDWAEAPKLRVTDQTRESLRKQIVLFIETGATRMDGRTHSAPFHHQGSGTINALVLALLSTIATLKDSVIFAMEEPEIAIPPHAQKRIVSSVRGLSSQTIFTSHSPYVLEEFPPGQIVVMSRAGGVLSGHQATLPPAVKPKAYKLDMRRRTCEALLARRVLVVEGATEYHALPAAARKLGSVLPGNYGSFEALGIAVVDAETDSQIAPLSSYFKGLGKTVFAAFDKQDPAQLALIEAACDHPFESPEKGFENLILNQSDSAALRRYAEKLEEDGEWPPHLAGSTPSSWADDAALRVGLLEYFKWQKASGSIALFLEGCAENEMPQYVRDTVAAIKGIVTPPPPQAPAQAPPGV
jgi:putative ATP-dependent endonuclease of OLD family